MQLLKEITNFCCTNIFCLKNNKVSGLTRFWGNHIFKKDPGKLEGEQWGGERTELQHVQVLWEELRIGSLDTQKHLLHFVKEPVGRNYEVTGFIAIEERIF